MLTRIKFFLIFFLLVIFYLLRLQQQLNFPFKDGQRVKITAKLTQQSQIKNQKQIFKIKGILIKTKNTIQFQYGDELELIGRIKKKGTNSFLPQYQLLNPQINRIQSSRTIIKVIFHFRSKLERIINQVLPEPQASLLIGIVLGVSRTLGAGFYRSLKITGTLHVIVASGMNISLMAGNLKEFLSHFLGRKLSLCVALIVILIYSVMAGMNPPIVRAALMAIILFLANFIGREVFGLWVLILSALLMLIFNPLLLFDVGFQLSFSATAGLILISPFFEKRFHKLPWLSPISGEIAETLSAVIFTFPILLVTFGHFNPLSLIPNMFILPLISYIMYLGLLVVFGGLFLPSLGQFLGWLVWLPLTYMIKVITFFGRFDFFYLNLKGFSWLFALGYYLVLFSLLLKRETE